MPKTIWYLFQYSERHRHFVSAVSKEKITKTQHLRSTQFKERSGAGDMAESVKHLSYKCEGLPTFL